MHCLGLLACLVVVTSAAPSVVHWFEMEPAKKAQPEHHSPDVQEAYENFHSFKSLYTKSYENLEEEYKRFGVFLKNYQKIKSHNIEYENGKHTYKLGVNQFADLTSDEFASTMNGLKKKDASKSTDCSSFLAASNVALPDNVDWRTQGYVTPVKNQGQCGSCWSFSTTGSLEGQHFKKSGVLVSLSEQQLVDCSTDYGNDGCNGGLMDQAFKYLKKFGSDPEKDYPYLAEEEKVCKYNSSDIAARVTGCVDVTSQDESALQKAVGTVGPVSVAIDASHQSFQFYAHGVYNEPQCSSTELDHGVLAIGYGSDDGLDYWLVKNSWGAGWGVEGYVKMARNHNNMCGIATQASYPLV